MVIDSFDPEYIAKVGFPIAAFVAAFGIVSIITTLIIKSQLKRQERLDVCLDTKLNNIQDELTKVVIEMRTVSTKIDTYINTLDQYFGHKNIAYVFREGKIDKIKNIIEEREIIQDIKERPNNSK